MAQAVRRLPAIVAKAKTCLVFINQIREKIGVMFGSPETQPGGRALKFYASVRIDLRRIGQIKNGEEVIGSRIRATVVKNKIAPPFRRTEFDVFFNEGISKEGDVLDLGVATEGAERTGPWLAFEGGKIGQGRDKARLFLKENPDLLARIAARIHENAAKAAIPPGGAAAAPAGEAE